MEQTIVFKPTKSINHKERITIGNKNYVLYYQYNVSQNTWSLSIYEKKLIQENVRNLVPIVLNITIVTGVDLLKQFSYLNIGKLWFWSIDQENIDRPTSNDLHINFMATWAYEV